MSLIVESPTLAAGATTATAGASAQLIGKNEQRNGLSVSVDTASANPVYLLLGLGTASATNFHYALAAGGSWNGEVTGVLWTGPVQFFSAGANKVGVVEV